MCGPVKFHGEVSFVLIALFMNKIQYLDLLIKFLSKYATKVLLSYKDSVKYFKNKDNLYYSG